MSKPLLKVWCLSDGKPGHYNQSKGLVQALSCGHKVQLKWIEVRLNAKPLRWLLKLLLNAGIGHQWIANRYSVTHSDDKPDLIVSTGGNTSFLNAAMAKLLPCKNYYIGSLRGLDPKLFHYVFTIEPVEGADNNIVMPLAPVPANRNQQKRAGGELQAKHEGRLWTLLIGGTSKEYKYSDEEWVALANKMNSLAREHEIRWLVTTSRRTGVGVEKRLEELLDEDVIAEAVWFCHLPRKVMAGYLGAAERIFCTEDSLSMLTEAVSTGKSVVSLYPQQSQPDDRYYQAITRLQENSWIERQSISALQPGSKEPGQRNGDPLQHIWQQIKAADQQARADQFAERSKS